MKILVRGMKALGDCVFQRPYVRKLVGEGHRVHLITPWPQLYSDLDVSIVRAETKNRSAARNVSRTKYPWASAPDDVDLEIRVSYDAGPTSMGKSFGWPELCLRPELPELSTVVSNGKPVAIVRPVTIRRERNNKSRDPEWVYLWRAASMLLDTHDVWIVGDSGEVKVGELPPHHFSAMEGEFPITSLMALIKTADIVVSGVGSFVPISVALNCNALIVLGGWGAQNAPDRVTHPSWGHKVRFIKPDQFCMCNNANHNCSKGISRFDEQVTGIFSELRLNS